MKELNLDKPSVLKLLNEDDQEGDITNTIPDKLDEYNSQSRHKFIKGNENLFNLKRASNLTKDEILQKTFQSNENENLAKLIIQTERNASVGKGNGFEEAKRIYNENRKNSIEKTKNSKNNNRKRIEIRENKTDINESVTNKNLKLIYNEFFQKSKQFSSQKEADIERLKKKINEERERECTFQPIINESSAKTSKYNYKNFMKNLAKYNLNKFNSSKRDFNNKIIQENYQTYHPTINNNSIKIISRNNIYKTLPIYDRLYSSKEDFINKGSKIIIPSSIKKFKKSLSPNISKNYLEKSKMYIKEL